MEYDIYLAGPFFNPQQKATMDAAKAVLIAAGAKVCDPRDLNPVLVDMDPAERKAHTTKIYNGNIEAMINSSSIFACIDDRDTGTAFELGYMAAMRDSMTTGLPIITFSGFGHGANVMLSEATDAHFQYIADLAAFVDEYGLPREGNKLRWQQGIAERAVAKAEATE